METALFQQECLNFVCPHFRFKAWEMKIIVFKDHHLEFSNKCDITANKWCIRLEFGEPNGSVKGMVLNLYLIDK